MAREQQIRAAEWIKNTVKKAKKDLTSVQVNDLYDALDQMLLDIEGEKIAKSKSKTKKARKARVRCRNCGTVRTINDYHLDNGGLLKFKEVFPVCKHCLEEFFKIRGREALIEICIWLNYPVKEDLLDRIMERHKGFMEGKVLNKPIGEYIRLIQLSFKDEVMPGFWEYKFSSAFKEELQEEKPEIEINDEVKKFWGYLYKEDTDYLYLQNRYNTYMSTFPTEDSSRIELYKKVCMAELKAEKLLMEGEIKDYGTMQKAILDMQKSGKITPADKEENLGRAMGVEIEKLEQTEPADLIKERREYADAMGWGKRLDRDILRPFKDFWGVSNGE